MKFTHSHYNERLDQTARYEFRLSHLNKDAYFSLVVDLHEGQGRSERSMIACGQVTETHAWVPWIDQRASKWHLWDLNGSMHYISNALYWLGWQGWHSNSNFSPPDPSVFKRNTNWGVIPADLTIDVDSWVATNDPIVQNYPEVFATRVRGGPEFLPAYIEEMKTPIVDYLTERLPRVREKFITDMLYIFGEQGGFLPIDILKELES